MTRPDATEYGSYYERYIEGIQGDDIRAVLQAQGEDVLQLFATLSEQQALHRYAPGKWSIKEVSGHLIDTERVFVYRAFRFSRNDATPLHGYDHDKYIEVSNYDARSFQEIVAEFASQRNATIAFFAGLTDGMMMRRGVANSNEFTVRAMAWIIAGHTEHHLSVLKDKYL